jgi:hypothetical protein
MSDEDAGHAAARRLRMFAAVYVMYVGTLGVLLGWVAVTTAYFSGDWRVVLDFGRLGEGPMELVVLTLLVTILPLGWMGFHEALQWS